MREIELQKNLDFIIQREEAPAWSRRRVSRREDWDYKQVTGQLIQDRD